MHLKELSKRDIKNEEDRIGASLEIFGHMKSKTVISAHFCGVQDMRESARWKWNRETDILKRPTMVLETF